MIEWQKVASAAGEIIHTPLNAALRSLGSLDSWAEGGQKCLKSFAFGSVGAAIVGAFPGRHTRAYELDI